jgi:hypothetical protein
LSQYGEPEMVTLVLERYLRSLFIFEGRTQWSLARWNKIKVSGRLSGKTVLVRAYLKLVSARVGSCFPWSTRPTCGDVT